MAPRQPAPSKPLKRKLAPDDFGIGAPAAPRVTPVFHVEPTRAQRAAARAKALREQQKRENDRIFKARQEIQTKAAIAARVAAAAGLPDAASPFAGVEKGKGPGAKKPQLTSDLTTKSKLAASRSQLRTQGGLLTPAQRRVATQAEKATATSRTPTFADRHVLPSDLSRPAVRLSQRDRDEILGRAKPIPPARIGAPQAPAEIKRSVMPAGRPLHGAPGGGLDLGNLGEAAKFALERTPFAGVPIGRFLAKGDAVSKAGESLRGNQKPLAHAAKVPLSWLNDEAKAKTNGQAPTIQDLTDVQRFGEYSLTMDARKALAPLIEANGYNLKDMPQWNDAEAIARAYGPKNEPSLSGLARNFAADVGTQLALGSAVRMYGDTIAQAVSKRSLTPIARLGGEYVEGYKNLLPFVGDRPWSEQVYEHPFMAPVAVAPFVKGGGNLIGKRALRLSPTREVTPPTLKAAVEKGVAEPGSERVTVSASQHPLGRLIQVGADKLMERAVNPDERTAKEQLKGAVRNPVGEAAHQAASVPQRVGHRLENRVERRMVEAEQAMARIRAGREPHLKLQAYLKAIRQTPFLRTIREGWGGKEREIENVVFHHGPSASSDQMAASIRGRAAEVQEQADMLRSWAAEARQAGDDVSARQFERAADDGDQIVKQQLEVAKSSEDAAMDIFQPKKGVQRLVKSMREASRTQGDILEAQGLMDEKGRLYGDWQIRASIIDNTEGPGMSHALPDGSATPAWEIVQKLKPVRQEFLDARAEFHGKPAAEIDDLAPSADVRSSEAEHHVGRNRLARRVQQIVEQKQRERQGRMNADAEFDPVETATGLGLPPRVVQRVVMDTGRQLARVFEGRQRGDQGRVHQLQGEVESLRRTEQAAHMEKTGAALRRAENDLRIANARNAPPEKVRALEERVKQAVQAQEEFRPSKSLLETQRQLEKRIFHNDMLGLNDKQINQIIDYHFKPERGELTPQQRYALRRVIQSEQDKFLPLNDLHFAARSMEADSATAFKGLTGKDVATAHRFDQASHAYLRALRALRDDQTALGHDPFHIHMHRPDTEYGLQPVRVTTGKQWEEANYTRDMHFLIARDLQGLSRRAVIAETFEGLSKTPLVIEKPPVGAEVPPGWVQVNREQWQNLTKVAKSREIERDLLDEWRKMGRQSHAGAIVEDDTMLITRNLRDWVETELKKGDPERELNPLLEATNAYRRWMLFSLPRTFVNNFVGNPMLAMVQGAGLRTLMESIQTLRKHPERVLHTLQARGVSANIMEKPNAKMTGWQNFWRTANKFAEDNGQLMVYLLHAKRAFKKENGLHWFNRVSRMNEHWGEFLEKAAKGENPDAAAWSAKSVEMFGDMFKTMKHDDKMATLFLFHRWVGHMIHLTLWTMPVKYPGRTAFLQQTALLADQYRKEHGVFPEWAQGMVPLWSTMEKAGGGLQKVTWGLGSQGVIPFGTAGQTFDLGSPAQPKSALQAAVASNISPLFRVPLEALYGERLDTLEPFKDYKGDEVGKGFNWRVFAQGAIANTPILNTVFPRAGLSDDSIQIPGLGGLHPRYSKTGEADESMRSPVAMGRGELYDWLLRAGSAMGAPIRPVDAEGTRSELSAEKTATYYQREKTKRDNKALAREGAASQRLWDKDPEAWKKSRFNQP